MMTESSCYIFVEGVNKKKVYLLSFPCSYTKLYLWIGKIEILRPGHKDTLFSMMKNGKHSPKDQEQDKGVHSHHSYST